MNDDVFSKCTEINDLLVQDKEGQARDKLIHLLGDYPEYNPLINHLIRRVGLYPYLQPNSALWQDRFIHEAFKVDVGGAKKATLHREQSAVLKSIIEGTDLVLIAPTSFGKSFVIDAYITIKKPANIMIIVPTIALTDETRRRLHKKFSDQYKLITTPNIDLGRKNIFIFPQERALDYIEKVKEIDMLIIDEFYKASVRFNKYRSKALLKVILKFSRKAKQKYFLAPNISTMQEDNPFTKGMKVEYIKDFNTVFLRVHDCYKEINNKSDKGKKLLEILNNTAEKSLIYAGTFTTITEVSNVLKEIDVSSHRILDNFADWLGKNYTEKWDLVELVKRGTGIHNGRLHRSLSQIQIKLFSEINGFKNIISTSSIIEGVNTSAKNVILYGNKDGTALLSHFGYKNLIGRSGRMLKHFIGEVYLLENPPADKSDSLSLDMPRELIEDESGNSLHVNAQTKKEVADFHIEMSELLGEDIYNTLRRDGFFEDHDWDKIRKVATHMKENPREWNGLGHLNGDDPSKWEWFLSKITYLYGGFPDYKKLIILTKVVSKNWIKTVSELLNELSEYSIDIDDFFKIERRISFNLTHALKCVNKLQEGILYNRKNISPFIFKTSHAFLPKNVYLLEEYGLPRMLSKKIQLSGLVDLESNEKDLHSIIDKFNDMGCKHVIDKVNELMDFDKYILEYFFDGISSNAISNA